METHQINLRQNIRKTRHENKSPLPLGHACTLRTRTVLSTRGVQARRRIERLEGRITVGVDHRKEWQFHEKGNRCNLNRLRRQSLPFQCDKCRQWERHTSSSMGRAAVWHRHLGTGTSVRRGGGTTQTRVALRTSPVELGMLAFQDGAQKDRHHRYDQDACQQGSVVANGAGVFFSLRSIHGNSIKKFHKLSKVFQCRGSYLIKVCKLSTRPEPG